MLKGLILATSPLIQIHLDIYYQLLQVSVSDKFIIIKVYTSVAFCVGQYIQCWDLKWRSKYLSCSSKATILDEGEEMQNVLIGYKDLLHEHASEPIHYRGEITSILENYEGIALIEIDNSIKILTCTTELSTLISIGETRTFYNLSQGAFMDLEVAVFCPITSSTDLKTSHVSSPNIICLPEEAWWKHQQVNNISRALKGILSKKYFDSSEKSGKLMTRIKSVLSADALTINFDIIDAFNEHCKSGSCNACYTKSKYCCKEFFSIDQLIPTKDPINGYLIGVLKVCDDTGRTFINDSTGKIDIIFIGDIETMNLFDSLVIIPSPFYCEKISCILADKILFVSKIPSKSDYNPNHNFKEVLLMVINAGPPRRLSIKEPMFCQLQVYKFALVSMDKGIEMCNKERLSISVNAACITYLNLKSGDFICTSSIQRLDPIRKFIYNANPSLIGYHVQLLRNEKILLAVTCSNEAVQYFDTASLLLVGQTNTTLSLNDALLVDRSVPCIIVLVTGVSGTDIISDHLSIDVAQEMVRSQVLLPKDDSQCLLPGMKVKITKLSIHHLPHKQIFKATLDTTISIITYDPRDIHLSMEYPLKYIYELSKSSSDTEFVTLFGKFFNMDTLKLQFKCDSCGLVIENRKCISNCHGGMDLTSEIKMAFTDGTSNAYIIFTELQDLIFLHKSLNVSALQELACEYPINWHYSKHPKGPSKLDPLIIPLLELSEDVKLSCQVMLTMPSRTKKTHIPQLRFIGGEILDYVEQTERLISLISDL